MEVAEEHCWALNAAGVRNAPDGDKHVLDNVVHLVKFAKFLCLRALQHRVVWWHHPPKQVPKPCLQTTGRGRKCK